MRLNFKLGNFNVVKYADNHFCVSVWNKNEDAHSRLQFLNKTQLKQIRDEISRVLRDDDN